LGLSIICEVRVRAIEAFTNRGGDYQRHETRQPEKVLEFLKRMESEAGIGQHTTRIFVTGSGGGTLAEMIGAKFVQEVHAVALAVEKLHPEVYSVIELGGQDVNVDFWLDDRHEVRRNDLPSRFELLVHDLLNALCVGLFDKGAHLGSEYALRFGPGEQRSKIGHGPHLLNAALLRFEALVHF
jgi:hypothetical protein